MQCRYYAWMDTVIILTESSCCEGNERSLLHLSKFKVLAANNSSWHYFLTVVCIDQLSIEPKFNVLRSLKTEIISILFQGPCSNELQETHCFVSEEDQEQGAKKVILNLSYITFTGAKRQTSQNQETQDLIKIYFHSLNKSSGTFTT